MGSAADRDGGLVGGAAVGTDGLGTGGGGAVPLERVDVLLERLYAQVGALKVCLELLVLPYQVIVLELALVVYLSLLLDDHLQVLALLLV